MLFLLLNLSLTTSSLQVARRELALHSLLLNSQPLPSFQSCFNNEVCYTHSPPHTRLFFFFSVHPAPLTLPPPETDSGLSTSFFYRPQNARGSFSILPDCDRAFAIRFLNFSFTASRKCPLKDVASGLRLETVAKEQGTVVKLFVTEGNVVINSVQTESSLPVHVDDYSDVDFITPQNARKLDVMHECTCFDRCSRNITLRVAVQDYLPLVYTWGVQCDKMDGRFVIGGTAWRDEDVVRVGGYARVYIGWIGGRSRGRFKVEGCGWSREGMLENGRITKIAGWIRCGGCNVSVLGQGGGKMVVLDRKCAGWAWWIIGIVWVALMWMCKRGRKGRTA